MSAVHQNSRKSIIEIFKRNTNSEKDLEKKPSFWNKVARSASMIFTQQQKLNTNEEFEKKTPEHTLTSGLNSSNFGDSDSEDEDAEVIVQKNRFEVDSLTKEDLRKLEDDLAALEDDFPLVFDEEENELDNEKFKTTKPDNLASGNLEYTNNLGNFNNSILVDKRIEKTQNTQDDIFPFKQKSQEQKVVKRLNSLSNILNKNKKNGTRIRTFSEIKQSEERNFKSEKKKIEKKNLSENGIKRLNSLGSCQFEKGKEITRTNSFINSSLMRIDSSKITFNGKDQEEEQETEEEVDEMCSFLFSFSKDELLRFFNEDKGVTDPKIGFRTKSRMVIKKKKFMTVFSAIDVVSWFFANPEFFGKKKIKVSDAVLFGKLLEKLGIIENVSNLNL
eukprot:gene2064-1936_t